MRFTLLEFIFSKGKMSGFKAIHKKVVCRYFLNKTCLKGDNCEFLHVYKHDALPECRKGPMCGDPSCPLRHSDKLDRPRCANYDAGFCSFGYSCPLQHVFVDSPPSIAALFLKDDPAKKWVAHRQATQRSFRSAPCPYYESDGWCPYFSTCAFRHS